MATASRLRLRTLQRALEIVGDEQRLSRELRVPMEELRAWLAGRDMPPTAVFLSAVDIVEAHAEIYARPRFVERRRHPRPGAAPSPLGA